MHVFVLILFWACTVTLVFYCSYIQAEPNFLEHLKGACICIDIILGLYCDPCLLLQLPSLNQTSWNTWKVHVFVLILFWACIVIWPLSSIAATFRLNQTSWNTWKVHVFILLCCCRVSCITFPLLILSLNKRDWLKGTFPLVLDWLLVAGDNNNNDDWLYTYTWPSPPSIPHLYIFREID